MEENTGTITLAEWAKEYHKKQQQQAQKTESKGKKIPKYTTRFKFDLYEKVMVRLGIITGLPIYIKIDICRVVCIRIYLRITGKKRLQKDENMKIKKFHKLWKQPVWN